MLGDYIRNRSSNRRLRTSEHSLLGDWCLHLPSRSVKITILDSSVVFCDNPNDFICYEIITPDQLYELKVKYPVALGGERWLISVDSSDPNSVVLYDHYSYEKYSSGKPSSRACNCI